MTVMQSWISNGFLRYVTALIAAGWLMCASGVDAQAVAVEQHTDGLAVEVPDADETKLNVSTGGTLSTGNTQSWQLHVGSSLRLVRGPHAVAATADFIYGQSDPPDDARRGLEDTARNLNTKLRYDHFVTDFDAVFGAAAHRWDTFAGLVSRVQLQLGYLRNFTRKTDLRFWGELGYDLTIDTYTQKIVNAAAAAEKPIDREQVVHSVRGFVGYTNHLTEALTWDIGLEGLMSIEEPSDFRVNWDTALRSKINGSLQLEMKFGLKYDNVPVPGTRNLDTLTQVNLIYAAL